MRFARGSNRKAVYDKLSVLHIGQEIRFDSQGCNNTRGMFGDIAKSRLYIYNIGKLTKTKFKTRTIVNEKGLRVLFVKRIA